MFQYRLVPGPCPKSYGLHVAALAGIPAAVCAAADQVGSAFESRVARTFQRITGAGNDTDVGEQGTELLQELVKSVMHAGSEPQALRDAWCRTRRTLPALGIS